MRNCLVPCIKSVASNTIHLLMPDTTEYSRYPESVDNNVVVHDEKLDNAVRLLSKTSPASLATLKSYTRV